MGVFLKDWGNEADILEDFEIDKKELEGATILFAAYTHIDYDGCAFVLLLKDSKLYEVNGSHCSCYGLENQWELEVLSLKELRRRVKSNEAFDGFNKELEEFLNSEEFVELERILDKYNKAHK